MSSATSSLAGTSELRSLLWRRAREQERPKSSIGSVRIESFAGDRRRYLKWKKAVQAQQRLCRLDDSELAMLIYLSTVSEARDTLDQLPLDDYTCEGGLTVLWNLLDESLGETTPGLFERAEREPSSFRRLPGQSIAVYLTCPP